VSRSAQHDPLVTCVCLTRDRPELTQRAVECFRKQTYERKTLLMFDTGDRRYPGHIKRNGERHVWAPGLQMAPIGFLRNEANSAEPKAELIAHWDSDDWSHRYRLAEQVDYLLQTKAEAVGYNDMLFWNSSNQGAKQEAWLYSTHPHDDRFALGTSLLYWRRVWAKRPFGSIDEGEDRAWIKGVNCRGVSSTDHDCIDPRMIAHVHGGNSVATPTRFARWTDGTSTNWTRCAEMDAYCEHVMEGKIPALV